MTNINIKWREKQNKMKQNEINEEFISKQKSLTHPKNLRILQTLCMTAEENDNEEKKVL